MRHTLSRRVGPFPGVKELRHYGFNSFHFFVGPPHKKKPCFIKKNPCLFRSARVIEMQVAWNNQARTMADVDSGGVSLAASIEIHCDGPPFSGAVWNQGQPNHPQTMNHGSVHSCGHDNALAREGASLRASAWSRVSNTRVGLNALHLAFIKPQISFAHRHVLKHIDHVGSMLKER